MLLKCPHCQALYEITQDIGDAVSVCHQCGQEFSAHVKPVAEQQPWRELQWQCMSAGFATPPWQRIDIFAPIADSQGGGVVADGADEALNDAEAAVACPPQAELPDSIDIEHGEAEQAPVRKTPHIWPWLLTVLILLASAGFWVQKDAWLDNRWLRSTLINIGIDMLPRAKDWRIVPASVQPEWVARKDGGRMLYVRGDIKNLLGSEMPLPRINITFFSKIEPDKQIGASTLEIVLPPAAKQANQEKYGAAARDAIPASALGQRSFMIIAESVPEGTGDFTLTPAPR